MVCVKKEISSEFRFAEWVYSCYRKLTTKNSCCGCCETASYKLRLFSRYVKEIYV